MEAVSGSSLLHLRRSAMSLPSCQLASFRASRSPGCSSGVTLSRLSFAFTETLLLRPPTLRTMAAASQTQPVVTISGIVDYYELLGVDDDAPPAKVKYAYRQLAKQCHPDFLGEEGHNICVLLNEAYEVLMDPWKRDQYNAQLQQALEEKSDDYTGQILSKWCAGTKMGKNEDPAETRAVFVDEATCIGCKLCVWCAPGTFRLEPEYGRSRVFGHWLDTEDDIQAAMDSCPVSCIHWVQKTDLPALEYCIQNLVGRENVGVMMAGQGRPLEDVFVVAPRFLKQRKEREEKQAAAKRYSVAQEAARKRAAQQILQKQSGWLSTFGNLFGMNYSAATGSLGYAQEIDSDDSAVGRRKRCAPIGSQGEAGGGSIPTERALVPVSVYAKQRSELTEPSQQQ